MSEQTNIPLQIDFQNSTSKTSPECAAVLYYGYDFSNHEGKVTAQKEAFQEVTTDPGMVEAACISDSDTLLRYVQNNAQQLNQLHQSTKHEPAAACTVTKAILFSTQGFSYRNAIKQELEASMEQRNLRLCCFTCGLAICFAGCCDCCRKWSDAEEIDLKEDSYCRIIRERFPDQTKLGLVYQYM